MNEGGEGVNREECAAILRGAIKHREGTHKREITFCDANGNEFGKGTVEPMEDKLFQALKFALTCVEKSQS